MRSIRFGALAMVCSSLAVAGCGGGSGAGVSSGAGTTSTTGDQTATLGQIKLTFQGKIQPRVDSGGSGLTVTSAAGAAFSTIALFPSRTLANTKIAYAFDGEFGFESNGIQSTNGQTSSQFVYAPVWGPAGQLFFTSVDLKSPSVQLFTCLPDLSGPKELATVSPSPVQGQPVAVSPNGQKLAFGDERGNVDTVNIDGTKQTPLVAGGQPAFSPDGTKIAFIDANNGVSIIPVGGGSAFSFQPVSSGSAFAHPAWSPDGKLLAVEYDSSSSISTVKIYSVGDEAAYGEVHTPSGFNDFAPSFSPDGSQIVLIRSSSTSPNLGTVTTVSLSGENPMSVSPTGISTDFTPYPSWSPFPNAREYVGSSGSLYKTSAAGFLWGQVNNVFASLVSFTATTPSKAVITPQTTGSGPLVYTITADNLTGLKYTNSYIGLVTQILPYSGIAATSAVVSFDASTGLIETVAPFVSSRVATTLRAVHQGNNLVYTGKFLGIWNAEGQNLAPHGASKLVVDGAKGKLISFE